MDSKCTTSRARGKSFSWSINIGSFMSRKHGFPNMSFSAFDMFNSILCRGTLTCMSSKIFVLDFRFGGMFVLWVRGRFRLGSLSTSKNYGLIYARFFINYSKKYGLV